MDTLQPKLNKTEQDLLRKIKEINRLCIKFDKLKITKNKKKYHRQKYKYKQDDN